MSDYDDKQGTWPAVYFIRDDLNREKRILLEEMGDMGWSLTEENKERLRDINARVVEINHILYNVSMKMWKPEE